MTRSDRGARPVDVRASAVCGLGEGEADSLLTTGAKGSESSWYCSSSPGHDSTSTGSQSIADASTLGEGEAETLDEGEGERLTDAEVDDDGLLPGTCTGPATAW